MFNLLYHYITNPKKTLSFYTALNPTPAVILIIFLTSLSHAIYGDITLSILSIVFSCLGFFGTLLILSLIWDFTAQLLNCEAKSMQLFSWLGLSLLPTLLTPPLHLLSPIKPATNLFSLLLIFIPLGIAYLQILTLQSLYKISLKKALAIFFLPMIIVPIFLMVLLFVIGLML